MKQKFILKLCSTFLRMCELRGGRQLLIFFILAAGFIIGHVLPGWNSFTGKHVNCYI